MTRTIINESEEKSNEQYHEFGLDKTVIHTLQDSDLPPEESHSHAFGKRRKL